MTSVLLSLTLFVRALCLGEATCHACCELLREKPTWEETDSSVQAPAGTPDSPTDMGVILKGNLPPAEPGDDNSSS